MAEASFQEAGGGDRRGGERPLAAILLVSLLFKLLLLIPAHATYPVRDAGDYFEIAHQLYQTGELRGLRAPVYPATLAAAIHAAALLGGERALTPREKARRVHPRPPLSDLDLARLLQVLFSTVSVWLIYRLGLELFDRRAALAGAGLFAFTPELVGYSHLLWSETQFVMWNAAWLLLLLRGARSGRAATLFAAGALLGVAALTRQVVASFLPLLVAWLFLVRPRPWQRSVALGGALALGAALVVSPWAIRNARVHDAWVGIAPAGGIGLLFGVSDDIFAELERAGVTDDTPDLERNRRAGERARELILSDPAAWIDKMLRRNLPRLWAPDSFVLQHLRAEGTRRDLMGYDPVPDWLGRGIILLFVATYLILLVGALVGAALAPDWRSTLVFVGLVVHASLLHALVSGNSRQRLYLTAFGLLYAGFLFSRKRVELRSLATPGRIGFAVAGFAALGLVLAAVDYEVLTWRHVWRSFG